MPRRRPGVAAATARVEAERCEKVVKKAARGTSGVTNYTEGIYVATT